MYSRLLQTTRRNSFFLFGARGTGKTTWMRDAFDPDASLYLDLLDPEVEDLYRRTPGRLERQVGALPDSVEWVLIARAGALARSLMIRAVSLLSVTNRRHQTGHLQRVGRRPHGDTGVNKRSTAGVLYGIRNRGYSRRA